MFFLGTHPFSIALFFTVPALAWGLAAIAKDRAIWYILGLCIVLLSPTLTGYTYENDTIVIALIYLGSSCLYLFIVKYALGNLKSLFTVFVFLGVGFVVFCISAFISGFTGTATVEKIWETNDYKILYLKDQGWAGGSLMKYELYKYGYIPLFIKHVDTKVDNDTTNNCIVKFEYKNFSFDKCNSKL
jgi:hypothetical protein